MHRACTSVMKACPKACTACTQQVRQVRLLVTHTCSVCCVLALPQGHLVCQVCEL